MRIFRAFLLLAILSATAAVFGLGIAYQRHTASLIHTGSSFNIGRDGWVKDGAKLVLPRLAERGNRVSLQFNSWRPAIPDSVMAISVCKDQGTEYLIQAGTSIDVALRGDCDPFIVKFHVKNPVKLSPTDAREVGAQLEGVSVSSRLHIALCSPPLVLAATLAIFILASLVWLLLRPADLHALSLLVPFLCFIALRRADISNLDMPAWLALSSALIVLGAFLGLTQKQSSASNHTQPATLVTIGALIITAIGTWLRFHGLDFGLPNNFHPDEVPKVNAIMTMVNSHSLNPKYFLHPSLLLYCTYGLTYVMDHLGLVDDFRVSAFLAGRCVSATAGSLSIYLVYLIARRILSSSEALTATALFAFLPLHVTCSRYLKEDALLLFWILLCVLAVLRAVQNVRPGLLFLAAIFAGLAASTKYSGIIAAGIVATAPWLRSRNLLRPDPLFFRYTLAAGFIIPLAFVMSSPYIVLDPDDFASDFRYERLHMLRGHTEVIDAWSQFWMYHLGNSLQRGMTLLPLLSGLLGLGLALIGRRAEATWIAILALAFYLPAEWVKSKPAPQPERYIVPCLPFLSILGAHFLHQLAKSRRLAIVALPALVLAIIQPTWRSFSLARDINNDTRIQMSTWIKTHVPPGISIIADWEPYSAALPADLYNVEYIRRVNINSRLSIRALKQSGKNYLLLSSLFYERYFTQPRSDTSMKARFRSIFRHVPILKQVSAPSGSYAFHNPVLTLFSLKAEDFQRLDDEIDQQRQGRIALTSNQLQAYFPWAGETR
ncbi:MAG: glycosyltransferase family 39 protein [Oligoflexia bacterium]|nr:glycosyltransferase family 39 protein [Oligoflexia bacterium]